MPLRTILVPLTIGTDPTPCLDMALGIARRFGGHIEALFVRADVAGMVGLAGQAMVGIGSIIEIFEQESREATAAARSAFEAWPERRGLPSGIVDHRLGSVFASWSERVGDVE